MKTLTKFLIFLFLALPLAAQEKKEEPKRDVTHELYAFVFDKAKEYTGKAENAISKGVDLAMQEIPIVVNEFLVWRAWKHGFVIFSTIGLFLLIGLPLGLFSIYKQSQNAWNFDGYSVLMIICGLWSFMLLLTGPVWSQHILSFIQIQVAPRIYLIEELSKLVK